MSLTEKRKNRQHESKTTRSPLGEAQEINKQNARTSSLNGNERKRVKSNNGDIIQATTAAAAVDTRIKRHKLDSAAGTNGTKPSTDGTTRKKSFADLGVIEPLCDACAQLGYKIPTPIQIEAIPVALEGRDVVGVAETGSGKTAAFALPILQALMDKPQSFFALILAPTRELALQISQQFEALGALIAVRCAVLVGGMDMVPQAIALGRKPHIVVATPGRLLDHLENTKGFSLRLLKYLVMDEADRLLDLDFGPILEKILRVLPRGGGGRNSATTTQQQHVNGMEEEKEKKKMAPNPPGRTTMLFSATMSAKVEHLQRASLTSPVRVSVAASDHQTVASLRQSYIFIPHKHKDLYLVYLLAGDRSHIGGSGGSNSSSSGGIIVFTRTVSETQRLSILLRTLGLSAVPIHGQLSQSSRLSALNRFKASRAQTFSSSSTSNNSTTDILVATDVAARGLDIPAVSAVINYDLPPDSKTYVHRVGRTARAGRAGIAVSFVTQYDVEIWLRIERALGRRVDQLNASPGSGGGGGGGGRGRSAGEAVASTTAGTKGETGGRRKNTKNGTINNNNNNNDDDDDDDESSPSDSEPEHHHSSSSSSSPSNPNSAPNSNPNPNLNPILKDHVLVLHPRVSEAQRLAAKELRDMQENRGKRGAVLIGKRRMGMRGGRGGRGSGARGGRTSGARGTGGRRADNDAMDLDEA